jgi:hypothetical protein
MRVMEPDMRLRRLGRMVLGVFVMGVSEMGVMRPRFVIAVSHVRGGFAMMLGGVLMMFGGLLMVISSVLGVRHSRFLFFPASCGRR